ncbi:hypothetical protein CEV31_4417 [Brucella thiophenivorans]|uniref:Uncharacterized protein n=1 Tax=Brucella thiophenivorans TaxID=571255 RepID=A0A256FND3_9HYPH|nr:hypothetical protein CEV31_4417 [Brucella thiophenivorans]
MDDNIFQTHGRAQPGSVISKGEISIETASIFTRKLPQTNK